MTLCGYSDLQVSSSIESRVPTRTCDEATVRSSCSWDAGSQAVLLLPLSDGAHDIGIQAPQVHYRRIYLHQTGACRKCISTVLHLGCLDSSQMLLASGV